MRQPAAFDIVKAIKQFVSENEAKIMSPEDSMHVVGNFLTNVADSFRTHELWKGASEEDLDNAAEGLEKYVMSKMYRVYFQPRLSDDAVKDEILRDRIKLLSFLEPQHLDIEERCCRADLFEGAAGELVKMDSYKAPRDKIICILNAAKLLTKVLQDAHCDGADAFLPVLIYATLRANPPHLYSNLQFIHRFRNPAKLTGEAGYYLTHMFGAVAFIERLDASQLSIDPHAFEAGLSRTIQAHPASIAATAPAPATAPQHLSGAELMDTISQPPPSFPAPAAPAPVPVLTQPPLQPTLLSQPSTKAPSPLVASSSPAPSLGALSLVDTSRATPLLDLSANPHTNPTPIFSSSGHDLASLDPFSTTTPSPRAAAAALDSRPGGDLAGLHLPSTLARFSMLAQPAAAALPAPVPMQHDAGDFGSFSSSPAPAGAAASTGAAGVGLGTSGASHASSTSTLSQINLGPSSRGSPTQQFPHPATTTTNAAAAAAMHHAGPGPASAATAQVPRVSELQRSISSSSRGAAQGSHAGPHGPAPSGAQGQDPFMEGGIQQLLAAVSEPPVTKFLHCTIEELGMADVPLLLADYKRLAALNDSLARTLRLNVSV